MKNSLIRNFGLLVTCLVSCCMVATGADPVVLDWPPSSSVPALSIDGGEIGQPGGAWIYVRRGASTNIAALTLSQGVLVYDTTNDRLFVGDGSTSGGVQLTSYPDTFPLHRTIFFDDFERADTTQGQDFGGPLIGDPWYDYGKDLVPTSTWSITDGMLSSAAGNANLTYAMARLPTKPATITGRIQFVDLGSGDTEGQAVIAMMPGRYNAGEGNPWLPWWDSIHVRAARTYVTIDTFTDGVYASGLGLTNFTALDFDTPYDFVVTLDDDTVTASLNGVETSYTNASVSDLAGTYFYIENYWDAGTESTNIKWDWVRVLAPEDGRTSPKLLRDFYQLRRTDGPANPRVIIADGDLPPRWYRWASGSATQLEDVSWNDDGGTGEYSLEQGLVELSLASNSTNTLNKGVFVLDDNGSVWMHDASTAGGLPLFNQGIKVVSYASPLAIDFDDGPVQTVTATGNLTFTNTNGQASGFRTTTVYVTASGAARTVTLDSEWQQFGEASPITVPDGDTVIVRLDSLGTSEASVHATATLQN